MAGVSCRRVVFLGPPGSGKGTQAVNLAEALTIPAISTGDMLRAAVAAGTDLGRQVQAVMEAGELVSDDLMADVVRGRLSQDDAADGFLLDGYPRTEAQARTLDEILTGSDSELDHVVFLDVPEGVLVERALARRRVDDKAKVIRERLRVYREQTRPLIDRFRELGLLRAVDGDRTVEQVGAAILRAVEASA